MLHEIIIHEADDSDHSLVAAILDKLDLKYSVKPQKEQKQAPKKAKSWGNSTHLMLREGDTLRFINHPDETVTIIDDNHVSRNGVSMSLSKATIDVKTKLGGSAHHGYSGRNFWTFDGETLHRRGIRLGLK